MAKTVTVVGQGYVGLPLSQAAANADWKVFGFDLSERVVRSLNEGISHIDDLSDDDVKKMIEKGYVATVEPTVIKESDVVVICVPTPLGEAGAPDLGSVKGATATVAEHLQPGMTVILESTTYPGTTNEVCVPILENISGLTAGTDFYVAFSPERVNPGSEKFGIKNTPKLVGGYSVGSTRKAVEFYSAFVDVVVEMSGTKEAETAKLLENTFRHVNIALVNEMAKVCHELDIDIWEVIRGAATKPFGFMKFTPGAGVGGHCIPIDPNYLSYEVRRQLGYPLRFVELAQEINNSMPLYVVERIAERLNDDRLALNGSKVLILGVTYKPNIADQRESPAIPVAKGLMGRGAEVSFHDPKVEEWKISDSDTLEVEENLDKAVKEADLVLLLQNHREYAIEEIASNSQRFLDARGVAQDPQVRL
ncbi:UDP-N-acetyl-D-glucosamine dehydrogenase [Corynebacterium sp. HMSC072D12]|uniref:nucleotide sugar dehydrogenase n=1 Tax=Corynebacterium sp. HMSC072D12 TaxID=1739447 RepID=UPI0008A5217D|nr:nucleotide sugar dehydrogenase [Corynebacterium sp. HMSC072D12]OFQ37362.1 UDP-N-acetyl-D-glucosamine dehydrogenase [Corynebacterium sp. HMSC072D12]